MIPVARMEDCPDEMHVNADVLGNLQSGLRGGVPSVESARRGLARAFRQAGLDTPDLDARLLVGHALGLGHASLIAAAGRKLTTAEAEAIAAVASRRLASEPVARIVGTREFWGLDLRLDPETLVPRPESETVVEAALAALGLRRGQALRIADLGTGSGALLLAILSELPGAYGIGTDTNLAALKCARGNAAALGMANRASFVVCDYGAALAGKLDLLVSNPPYILRGEVPTLAPEVRLHDPLRALDGGADGLDGYRAIAADARRLLLPSGILVVELGSGQFTAVQSLFAATGLIPLAPRNDLLGIPRALTLLALP
jgi:release factor glutamine methyltransferase